MGPAAHAPPRPCAQRSDRQQQTRTLTPVEHGFGSVSHPGGSDPRRIPRAVAGSARPRGPGGTPGGWSGRAPRQPTEQLGAWSTLASATSAPATTELISGRCRGICPAPERGNPFIRMIPFTISRPPGHERHSRSIPLGPLPYVAGETEVLASDSARRVTATPTSRRRRAIRSWPTERTPPSSPEPRATPNVVGADRRVRAIAPCARPLDAPFGAPDNYLRVAIVSFTTIDICWSYPPLQCPGRSR